MAEATGLSAVLAEMDASGAAPAAEPEQLDLVGLPPPRPGARFVDKPRGAGRPPGARNKRTQAWADFLLARYASPLEVLMQIATAPVDELVAKLGCKPLEALGEKRLAAIGALPYLHQRQPLAIDLTNNRVVHLHIGDAPRAGETGDGGSGVTLLGHVAEIVENQGVDDATDPAV